MKIAVIGGGGVRSMFLTRSIARRAESLGIRELALMDTDAGKLKMFGGMAAQVAQQLAPGMRLSLTADAREAIKDADYVITTIRVGGDALRVRDERIALEAGVLGQETTGAAGFSFAMRSVPALAGICELVRLKARPGCRLFNFTNPVGIVSQALHDLGYDFALGICDAPSGMLAQFAALYGAQAREAQGELFGLNHLSWFYSVRIRGREVLDELLSSSEAHARTDLRFFEPRLLRALGAAPNEYLYYYYYRERAVENILKAERTRGEAILAFNRGMEEELARLGPGAGFEDQLHVYSKWYGRREAEYMASETGISRGTDWSFDVWGGDDGGYAGVALRYIDIVRSGEPGTMILTLPNAKAVDFLLPTDTVEASCTVTKEGCVPHPFPDIPPPQAELIRRVKYYERVGSRAILERNRDAAVEALTLHPLVNSYSLARGLADAYIRLNEAYCGGWSP